MSRDARDNASNIPRDRVQAYIGLGGNLGDPVAQMMAALEALDQLDEIRVAEVSSLYRSAPVGYQEQDDFFNAVAALETERAPLDLLDELLGLELVIGRVRNGPRFGPRVIDLDLLLYGDEEIDLPRLRVPHPRMFERRFVLAPLTEITPDIVIPGCGPAAESLTMITGQKVERVDRADSPETSGDVSNAWPGPGPFSGRF